MILIAAFVLAAAAPINGEFAKSERTMDRQFSFAIERLRSCHANTTKCYYWQRAIPRLKREQAAWKNWRNAKAELMAIEMEGTSGERDVTSYFKAKLNEERASELSKIGRR